jgi:glutathionylspermidine synthase
MYKMRLAEIPAEFFPKYRMDVMFDGYKWDSQSGEKSTISGKVLLVEREEIEPLIADALALYDETVAMEQALKSRPKLVTEMGISAEMADALCACEYNPAENIRFMRFDFHPTADGWRISEVNSDVPAGYPEASVLPRLAQKFFPAHEQCGCFGEVLAERAAQVFPAGCTIAYLHDTHTVEDYQIMRYLGDMMEGRGYRSLYAAPEHIKWNGNFAEEIGGIIRYYPAEWLEFGKGVDWRRFVNSCTPSCNHPLALLTQSKRLPLVWSALGCGKFPAWQRLLPPTAPAAELCEGWILKPAFGRVGQGINIPNTVSPQEAREIRNAAIKIPAQWVAQKMFTSTPLDGFHLTLGLFVIDGAFAGCYARASRSPRIDEDATEIPVLVSSENKELIQ